MFSAYAPDWNCHLVISSHSYIYNRLRYRKPIIINTYVTKYSFLLQQQYQRLLQLYYILRAHHDCNRHANAHDDCDAVDSDDEVNVGRKGQLIIYYLAHMHLATFDT